MNCKPIKAFWPSFLVKLSISCVSIFFCLSQAWAADANDPARYLTTKDYEIYSKTLDKCALGDAKAVALTALDIELLASGMKNWAQIAMVNINASRSRAQAGFLTPGLAELRNSSGYWLAMTHCFGQQEGFFSRGTMIKQLVDLGHLSTEVLSFTGVVGGLTKLTGLYELAAMQYPVAARFVTAVGLSLAVHQVLQIIKSDYFSDLSTEEKQKLEESSQVLFFKEANELIVEIDKMVQERLKKIDYQLAQLPISDRRIDNLMGQRQRLKASLQEMHRLKALSNTAP